MGMKKDAYDRAQLELIEKGYLTTTGGNRYSFSEKPVEGKAIHAVEVEAPTPQQVLPTRNTTEKIQTNTNKALPVISL